MKKSNLFCKFVSFVLVVVLMTSVMSGCGFFPSYQQDMDKYSNKNFEDMEYKRVDIDKFNKLAEEIKDLSSRFFKAGVVVDRYAQMLEIYAEAHTMYTICNIYNNIDVTDQYYIDEMAYITDLIFEMGNTFEEVTRVLYDSKCKGLVELYLGEEVWEYYLPDHDLKDTSVVSSLVSKEQELISEYNIIYTTEYTTTYNGNEYTTGELDLMMSELGEDKYYELVVEIARKKNADAGEIYLELIDVRNRIAKEYGYDTYAEYQYGELFRDYGPEQSAELSESVKKEFVDVYTNLYDSLDLDAAYSAGDIFSKYTSDELLSFSKKYITKIYPDMEDDFDFMVENNLVNIGNDSNRMQTSFVTYLNSYEVPFLFATVGGSISDFQTMVHEFGHYYAFKNYPVVASLGPDISEVHSQGLEVLSWEMYDEIYGENSHEVYKYMLYLICDSIIRGCMFDEFQQKVYSLENPTLSDINKIYFNLCHEYDLNVYDNGTGEAYMWVDIPHNFVAPFYYVSYAVSAVVSLDIWSTKLEDSDQALSLYLDYVENSSLISEFCSIVEESGLSSPFEADTIKEIAGRIDDFAENGEITEAVA